MNTNEYDLIFLYAGYIVSIIALIIAAILNPIFVIRLQIQQAAVKNGLAALRKQMLFLGFVNEIVIVISIFCLTARFFIFDVNILRYIITVAIVLFSFDLLACVIIFIQIYNQNYNERSIEVHRLISKIEEEMDGKKIDKKKQK